MVSYARCGAELEEKSSKRFWRKCETSKELCIVVFRIKDLRALQDKVHAGNCCSRPPWEMFSHQEVPVAVIGFCLVAKLRSWRRIVN
jgi:hypothetical protein